MKSPSTTTKTDTPRPSSLIRTITTSAIVLPLTLIVLFCFGYELVSFRNQNHPDSSTASHNPSTTSDETTDLPPLSITPQATLPTIETPTATSQADAVASQSAQTSGTSTLQPSSASTVPTAPVLQIPNNPAEQSPSTKFKMGLEKVLYKTIIVTPSKK